MNNEPSYSLQTEADIIKGCKQNAASAQQLLYTRYAPMLKSVCLRYIKDREEAKDVLHDGFIKIYNVIGKYKGDGSFEGWMKRIVINVAIDHLKKSQRLRTSPQDDWEKLDREESQMASSGSDTLLNTGFSTDDLLGMLHKIPMEFASVFNMFYIDQLSHKDIAETLQIEENTCRTRLFRAKSLVKKELEKELAIRQRTQWH